MALIVSPRREITVTPEDGYEYRLGVPTVLEKTEIEAAVIEAGIRPLGTVQMRGIMRGALARHIPAETRGEYEEALDRLEADEADAADHALLQTGEFLIAHDEVYRRALAMQRRWAPYLCWHALKRLLRGWKGLDAKFQAEHGEVPDDLLAQIPQEHFDAIATRALELFSVREDEAKNSESP